ncbi:hypothetical protein RE628_21225 [Paenibacillus sp. D2_2]|uniref:hypothetical protein n=1 Tax=Paenibacillus sp. D2_2 TaxID=3073092 RepID=UPI002814A24C|nr:hypothetical protein [Paenibacillus sp. D2_2]WMT39860.1 hypothetical protein RE628_21225 [Paenibacillus sp. D2_2]
MSDIPVIFYVIAIIAFFVYANLSMNSPTLSFCTLFIVFGALFFIGIKLSVSDQTVERFGVIIGASVIGHGLGFVSGIIERARKIGKKLDRWSDED